MTRVLIVEDNLDLANVVRSLLEFENHTVDVFHTGTEGLHSILSNPYDLVILDWDLPGVNGFEILTQFRQIGARTPVIMLTGKDTIEEKEAGLDGGADDYLTKPFNMKELGARVRAHIRRSAVGSSTTINFGDISLDCANQRATRGGKTHQLPVQEFQLLEFAAKYPHIKPSCEELLKSVWPSDTDKNEQILRMAIRRLRKKFDPTARLIFSHLFPEAKQAFDSLDENGGDTAPDADPFIGTILDGKYELTDLIGGGGSGLVYRGKHVVLGNTVALKILHLSVLSRSDMVQRFQREARLTGLLSHPNIVAVRDFGLSQQNQPYLVMELIEGASLGEVLEKHGRPPLFECVNIFYQACAGLEHAHKKGLVHRDIKPSNLMLTDNGTAGVMVKLVDFGLARTTAVEPGIAKITQTGHVFGSPPYMSPEQCRGMEVDARADIYSVGCAFFEALQGWPPFLGKDPVDVLIKHVSEPPPPLVFEDVPYQVHIRLSNIVAKCLHKDPDKRYQSVSDLMRALDQVLSENRPVESEAMVTPADMAEKPWGEHKKNVLAWLGRRFKP